jgi:hypothetical protein
MEELDHVERTVTRRGEEPLIEVKRVWLGRVIVELAE